MNVGVVAPTTSVDRVVIFSTSTNEIHMFVICTMVTPHTHILELVQTKVMALLLTFLQL